MAACKLCHAYDLITCRKRLPVVPEGAQSLIIEEDVFNLHVLQVLRNNNLELRADAIIPRDDL